MIFTSRKSLIAAASDKRAPTVTIASSLSSPTIVTPIPLTFTWSEQVTGFSSGDISISNGTLNNFSGSGSSYSASIIPTNGGTVTVDIAAGVCIDHSGNTNITATQFTILYGAYDFSTYSDGPLPEEWLGSTWSASSGKIINTPTLGSEVVTNGGMETGSPPIGWASNNTTLVADADVHSGSQAIKITSNALAAGASQNVAVVKDVWYTHSEWVKRTVGQIDLLVIGAHTSTQSNSPYHLSPSIYTNYQGSILMGGTILSLFLRGWDNGTVAYWDDISVKPLTTSQLFMTRDFGFSYVNIKAGMIISNYFPLGLVSNLDSVSNPKYYILACRQARNQVGLFKCINGVYTELINASATYVSGAQLEIRKTAANIYQLWYNGVQVGADQTVTDVNLNNNTIHGLFSTGSSSQIANFYISTGAMTDAQTVAIGGSITYGSAASATANIYHQLVASWLRSRYVTKNIIMTNAGVSATGSTYGLIRLQNDVIGLNPELVIIEFAVNDHDTSYEKAAAEALIRRLRTDLPSAKLAAVFFLTVGSASINDPTNVSDAVLQNWKTLCELYSIPYADFAAEVLRAVNASEHIVGDYMNDIVHPKDLGHSTAATLLENVMPTLFAGAQVGGALPSRIYDNGDYENTPTIRDGIDNDGETGTGWMTSSDGTSRESSTADDTLTYTGTFQMIIRDFQIGGSNGIVATKVDNEAWFNINLASDGSNYRTHWIGTRGAHTVIFKVVSGRVKLRRFLTI